jgi:hypothetical protein
MRRLGLKESGMDGPNEFANGNVEDPVARTIIAVANEHAPEDFRRQFVHVSVLHAEVDRATKDLEMSEVGGDTMEKGVENTAKTARGSGRREAVAEGNSRAHGKAPVFGGAVGMLKHGGGGVHEGSPLAFHFGELAVGVRGRKLGSVTQRSDHGAASHIKVFQITIELDAGEHK